MPRPKSDIDERIVTAARSRFLAEGVDGASLRSIAADAGTNVGMIYYYFPTKDDLFLAVVESAYARLLDDLTGILAPEHEVRARLRGVYQRVARITDEEFDVVRIVFREAMVSSERLKKVVARLQAGHLPLVLRTLQEGMSTGTLRSDLPLPALAASIGTLAIFPQLLARRLTKQIPMLAAVLPKPEVLADSLLEIALHGVGKR